MSVGDEALCEAKLAGRNHVVVKGTDAYLLLDTGVFTTALNRNNPTERNLQI